MLSEATIVADAEEFLEFYGEFSGEFLVGVSGRVG